MADLMGLFPNFFFKSGPISYDFSASKTADSTIFFCNFCEMGPSFKEHAQNLSYGVVLLKLNAVKVKCFTLCNFFPCLT